MSIRPFYCIANLCSHSQLAPNSISNKRCLRRFSLQDRKSARPQPNTNIKFFSASAYLIASLACVASSSSSDAPSGNCRRKLPDVTKHDIDDFLGIPHYPDFYTTLSGAAPDWPMEAYDDLRRYFNRGPHDDHIRRKSFECLLEKLNREAEDELREKWPDHVRTRETSDGDAGQIYSLQTGVFHYKMKVSIHLPMYLVYCRGTSVTVFLVLVALQQT